MTSGCGESPVLREQATLMRTSCTSNAALMPKRGSVTTPAASEAMREDSSPKRRPGAGTSCAAAVLEERVQKMEGARLPPESTMLSRMLFTSALLGSVLLMSHGDELSLGRYDVGRGVKGAMKREVIDSVRTGELMVLPQTVHEKIAVRDAFSEPESTKVAFIGILAEVAAAGQTSVCVLLESCRALGLSLLTVDQEHIMFALDAGDVVLMMKPTVVLT